MDYKGSVLWSLEHHSIQNTMIDGKRALLTTKMKDWRLVNSDPPRNHLVCTVTRRSFDGEREQGKTFLEKGELQPRMLDKFPLAWSTEAQHSILSISPNKVRVKFCR